MLTTKRILNPKYKLSGGLSFTFTVACSRDNSPLWQQQIYPNTVRISNNKLQVLRRSASRESNWPNEASDSFSPMGMCKRAGTCTSSGKIFGDSFDKKFSGVPSKIFFFIAIFYWNSINSSWILAASTPVVSNCRSFAPPPSSVNDGLPTNISEDAQQGCGTYKISTKSLIHTCVCVFCFIWNFSNVCHLKGFWRKSSNCFRKEKSPNCSAMLVVSFSLSFP